jgi:Zn-dependent protease with chaperone function
VILAAATALLVGSVAVGWVAGPAIMLRPWWLREPKPAATFLIIASVSTVLGVAGAAAALVSALPGPTHEVVEETLWCLTPHPHSHPDDKLGRAAIAVFVTLVAITLARITHVVVAVRLARRRHRERLKMVADDLSGHPDAVVVEHPTPLVYCLPDRRRGIVVTRGALTHLRSGELAAAFAHERAHLRQRHHALILLVEVLAIVLPPLPTLRLTRDTVPLLLEMVADDAAVRAAGAETVAAALDRLADAVVPPGALAATAPRNTLSLRTARLRHVGQDTRTRRDGMPPVWALAAWSTVGLTLIAPLTLAALLAAC